MVSAGPLSSFVLTRNQCTHTTGTEFVFRFPDCPWSDESNTALSFHATFVQSCHRFLISAVFPNVHVIDDKT